MSEAAGERALGPLRGIRILDLTRLLPGPVASMHLADLGADVIKIEDPGGGDYAREMGPGAQDGSSAFFRAVNRNKRGLILDLKRPTGVEAFLRLAERADVIIESFRPGVVDRLGIAYDVVAARNPRIVYCGLTGYGQTGPWCGHAGHDLNYIATAGVLDQIGVAGGPPAIPSVQIGDLLGGALSAVMGILAALVEARGTGRGRHIDVAMTDSVYAHQLFPAFAVQAGQASPLRGADELTGGVPWYAVYRTADERWLAVAPLEFKFWERFCCAVGRPDLITSHGAAGTDAERLRQELTRIFATKSLDQWAPIFADADCCVTPVLTPAEAAEHAQLLARRMNVDGPDGEALAPPVKMSDWQFVIRRRAPKAGEHGREILHEAGFSDGEISALLGR